MFVANISFVRIIFRLFPWIFFVVTWFPSSFCWEQSQRHTGCHFYSCVHTSVGANWSSRSRFWYHGYRVQASYWPSLMRLTPGQGIIRSPGLSLFKIWATTLELLLPDSQTYIMLPPNLKIYFFEYRETICACWVLFKRFFVVFSALNHCYKEKVLNRVFVEWFVKE